MNYNILVSERAFQKIDKAAQWYFVHSAGIEKKFLNDLKKSMNYIKKHPLKVQCRYKDVRIKFLKKFDFGIHYIIENQTIFVIDFFHTSENNDNWF